MPAGSDAVSVQISHHKAAGRWNWGKVKTTLAMVDRAREEGLDVNSDVYPYAAGSTVLSAMILPMSSSPTSVTGRSTARSARSPIRTSG